MQGMVINKKSKSKTRIEVSGYLLPTSCPTTKSINQFKIKDIAHTSVICPKMLPGNI